MKPVTSNPKSEAQKIKEVQEQFQNVKTNSSKSIRTSSSESIYSEKIPPNERNSTQQGDFTSLFKDFQAKEEESNPLACLMLHLQ